MKHFITIVCILLLLTVSHETLATEELDKASFDAFLKSGKNGMIKFFQPWCGHCKRIKPDWDRLAAEAHSSVLIADVNCSDQKELCQENDVASYPTIMMYKDGKAEKYNGPRGFDDLFEFVHTELMTKCDISKATETCSEKAEPYITKWKEKSDKDVENELQRLSGMVNKPMGKGLKVWLRERITILEQLSPTQES